MPRRSKIVDEAEALRMLRGGATYPEMVRFYRAKYGIETTKSTWSRFYQKHNDGSDVRMVLHYGMIPWEVPPGFKGARLLEGLRGISRELQGFPLGDAARRYAVNLRKRLLLNDTVVDFDYELSSFVEVPRRHGIDQGWIRDPFVADDGSPVSLKELPRLRTEAIIAYEDSEGLCVQDFSRPLAEGESRFRG